jgi:molybdenum cofactor cytidylyltransferase
VSVTAIVLAAGLSTRMGKPKMLLPWGGQSVLGHVLSTLAEAGVERRVVVVGSERAAVEAVCSHAGARAVFNPEFHTSEMLSSLQVGLRCLPSECTAALVVLGDQPSMEAHVVESLLPLDEALPACIIVPSYERRRGHPWLVGSDWWAEILQMSAPETPRDFLQRHDATIKYVEVTTDSVLRDIDTPADYLKSAP